MLRLCLPPLLPSAAEEGFPLCSPAKIYPQIPVSSQLVAQQSKLVGFDVNWEGWSHWGAEKIPLVLTCHSVGATTELQLLFLLVPLPHFLLSLLCPSLEPLGVFCCSRVAPVLCPSLSILIPASRASPSLRVLCLPLVITELETEGWGVHLSNGAVTFLGKFVSARLGPGDVGSSHKAATHSSPRMQPKHNNKIRNNHMCPRGNKVERGNHSYF